MRKMKDSGIEWIGEIPENWVIVRNKNVFSCTKRLVGSEYINTQLLSLTTRGIKEKDINNAEGKLPESFETYQYVRKDDLVMCLFDLDCSAVFSGISKFDGMISPAYRILSCKENIVPRYADYWFQYISDGRKFNHYAKNVRCTLTYDEFSTLPIILPSFKEQTCIADYLDDKCSKIDVLIDKQQKVIHKLKEYKKTTITEAVTKGLNPNVEMKDSGIEYVGEVPREWLICRLRNIGTTQNGISKSGDFFGRGYPFVSYGDVYNNFSLPQKVAGLVDTTIEERHNYSVKRGDIFFTRTSETIEEVGFASVCEHTISNATFAGFLIRVRPQNNNMTTSYAKYYFRSKHLRYYFAKEMNLVTRASLGQDLLKSMPILLPSQAEQQEISEYLNKKMKVINDLIYKKKDIIDKLMIYKKSLIYEVITGKKEV